MDIRPLTKKQQKFAEDNHELVYDFLNKKELSEDIYYDVVIFGYLKAVREYCLNPKCYKYKFSTVAWRQMKSSLISYRRYISSKKRNERVVSLNEPIGNKDGLCMEDVVSHNDEGMIKIQSELLMKDMERQLPRQAMRIVRMKVEGKRMHDIAKFEHMTFHQINELLQKIYPTVIKIFYE